MSAPESAGARLARIAGRVLLAAIALLGIVQFARGRIDALQLVFLLVGLGVVSAFFSSISARLDRRR